MKQTPLVIYHGNCMDGYTAAWSCWLRHPDWEFYPATHGEPPPDVKDRAVYLLDFCYHALTMFQIASKAESLTVLDHHISAEQDLQLVVGTTETWSHVQVHFDMNRSAAALAWEYFHPETPVPKFVQIVEDRDLGRFALAETRNIAAAIFSYPYNFQGWNQLRWRCEDSLHELVTEGIAIERKHHKDIAELVRVCRTSARIGGYNVPVANLPYTLASDAGHLLLADGAPFAATYYETEHHRVYSLHSRQDGLDVAEIARRYGGGGHCHDAGFRMLLSEVTH